MHAMILAAGRGERLRPLTDSTPKPLLKVGHLRLIEYQIAALKKAEVRYIVINVSWMAEKIRATLGAGERYGVKIIYSDESGRPLETAGGIIEALPLLGESPFIVCSADVWTDFDYSTLVLKAGCLAHLVLVDNPVHHPEGDFSLRRGRLVKTDGSGATFSGIGIYHPALFADLTPGRRTLASVLHAAVENDVISGELYRGNWHDVGTPARLEKLERFLGEEHAFTA